MKRFLNFKENSILLETNLLMKANSFSNTHYFHNFHITNAKGTGAQNFPSVGKELPVPPACVK